MNTRQIIAVIPQDSCLPPTYNLTYVNDNSQSYDLFADDTIKLLSVLDKNVKYTAIQLKHKLNLS